MKTYIKLFFLIYILTVLKANGQSYLISFAGNGATNTVSTVIVENLTKEASLTLNGGDILHLTEIITGVNPDPDNQVLKLKIYPNPMVDNSVIQINPPGAGIAIISVNDISGKEVAGIQCYLDNSRQDFLLSGLKKGFYLINIKGEGYQLSGKLISNANSGGTIKIEKVNNIIQTAEEKTNKMESKGIQGTIDMEYSTGDRIKFTGISGTYKTIITDIPTSTKTITFNFIPCLDGDNNNYPVVHIGTQDWMAENLKTTKFSDGMDIQLVTDESVWGDPDVSNPAYCWYNNENSNKNPFGALYNFFAVNSDKLCPLGWHIPDNDEWKTLMYFLDPNSTGPPPGPIPNWQSNIAGGKLKETGTSHWASPNSDATDEHGFTALPGGYRQWDPPFSSHFIDFGSFCYWWSSTIFDSIDAFGIMVGYNNGGFMIFPNGMYGHGFSVRCIKDI